MATINGDVNVHLQEVNRDGTDQTSPDKKRKRDGEEQNIIPYGSENDPARAKRPRTNIPHVFTAPTLWTCDFNADGNCIILEESRIIVGTSDGRIIYLDLNGDVQRQIQLIHPVGAIFKEGDQTFAWCYPRNKFQPWKGVLYELTLTEPRLLFDIEGFGDGLTHACMVDGCLVLADDKGTIGVFGCDGGLLWQREETEGFGGLLAGDDAGIYVSTKKFVRKLQLSDGEVIWEHEMTGATRHVGCQHGLLEENSVYVHGAGKIIELKRDTGDVIREIVPTRHRAGGIAIGNGQLVTGSCPTVSFDIESGEELFRMNFSGRFDKAATALHKSGKLIAAWDKIYCINMTQEGVMRAIEGRSQRTLEKQVTGEVPEFIIESPYYTTEHSDGIAVKCVMVDGQLTGRTEHPDYNDTYNVRIPMTWKEEGNMFYMDKLLESKAGKFYTPCGNIKLSMPETVTTPEGSPAPMAPMTPKATPKNQKEEGSPNSATPFRRGPEAMKPVEEIDLSAGIIHVPASAEPPRSGNRNKWTPAGVAVTPTGNGVAPNGKVDSPMDTTTPSRKDTPKGTEFPKIMRPSAHLFKSTPSPKKNSPSQK